jgi:nucleoside-diphosphate-sugar epimerase
MTPPQVPHLPCEPADADHFLSRPSPEVVEAVNRLPGDFMVLGAGGKMGLHLSLMLKKALQEKGSNQQVVAVSRFGSVNDCGPFESAGVVTRKCDLCDPHELQQLEPVENVFFMAGAKFGTAGKPELLQLMNVEMPARVADHFKKSRITAFSTGCVYPFVSTSSSGSSETSETGTEGDYARSCVGREQAFLKSAAVHQTRLALIRLNYSVEFRYGVLVDIATKVLSGDSVDVSSGHVNVVWQRDAVAQTLLAHERTASPPFIINITGPEVLEVRRLAEQFGKIFGKTPRFSSTEADTAWLSNSSLSQKLFGLPETTVDEMITWIAAWLLEGQPTHGKPTGFEKRDGNF